MRMVNGELPPRVLRLNLLLLSSSFLLLSSAILPSFILNLSAFPVTPSSLPSSLSSSSSLPRGKRDHLTLPLLSLLPADSSLLFFPASCPSFSSPLSHSPQPPPLQPSPLFFGSASSLSSSSSSPFFSSFPLFSLCFSSWADSSSPSSPSLVSLLSVSASSSGLSSAIPGRLSASREVETAVETPQRKRRRRTDFPSCLSLSPAAPSYTPPPLFFLKPPHLSSSSSSCLFCLPARPCSSRHPAFLRPSFSSSLSLSSSSEGYPKEASSYSSFSRPLNSLSLSQGTNHGRCGFTSSSFLSSFSPGSLFAGYSSPSSEAASSSLSLSSYRVSSSRSGLRVPIFSSCIFFPSSSFSLGKGFLCGFSALSKPALDKKSYGFVKEQERGGEEKQEEEDRRTLLLSFSRVDHRHGAGEGDGRGEDEGKTSGVSTPSFPSSSSCYEDTSPSPLSSSSGQGKELLPWRSGGEEQRRGGEEGGREREQEDVDISFLLKRVEELPRDYIEGLIADFRENLPHLFPSVHALFIQEVHKSITAAAASQEQGQWGVRTLHGSGSPTQKQAVPDDSTKDGGEEGKEGSEGAVDHSTRDERDKETEEEEETEKGEEEEDQKTGGGGGEGEESESAGERSLLPETTLSDSLFDDLSIYTSCQLRLLLRLLLQQAEKIDKEEEANSSSSPSPTPPSASGVHTLEEEGFSSETGSKSPTTPPGSQEEAKTQAPSSSSSADVEGNSLWERLRGEEETEDSDSVFSSSAPSPPLREVLASRKEMSSLEEIPRYELVDLLEQLAPFIAALPFDDFLNTPNGCTTEQLRDLVGLGLARMEQCIYTPKDSKILGRISKWKKRRLAYIEETRKAEEKRDSSLLAERLVDSSEPREKTRDQEREAADVGKSLEGDRRVKEEEEEEERNEEKEAEKRITARGVEDEQRKTLRRLVEGDEGEARESASVHTPYRSQVEIRTGLEGRDVPTGEENMEEKKKKKKEERRTKWRLEKELPHLNLSGGSGVLDERQLSNLSLSMSRGVYGVKAMLKNPGNEDGSTSLSSKEEGEGEAEQEIDVADLKEEEFLFRIADEEENGEGEEEGKGEEDVDRKKRGEKKEEESSLGLIDRAELEGMSLADQSLAGADVCEMGVYTLRNILSNRENAVYIHPKLRRKEVLEALAWRELRDAYSAMLRRIQEKEDVDVIQGERLIVEEDPRERPLLPDSTKSPRRREERKKKKQKKDSVESETEESRKEKRGDRQERKEKKKKKRFDHGEERGGGAEEEEEKEKEEKSSAGCPGVGSRSSFSFWLYDEGADTSEKDDDFRRKYARTTRGGGEEEVGGMLREEELRRGRETAAAHGGCLPYLAARIRSSQDSLSVRTETSRNETRQGAFPNDTWGKDSSSFSSPSSLSESAPAPPFSASFSLEGRLEERKGRKTLRSSLSTASLSSSRGEEEEEEALPAKGSACLQKEATVSSPPESCEGDNRFHPQHNSEEKEEKKQEKEEQDGGGKNEEKDETVRATSRVLSSSCSSSVVSSTHPSQSSFLTTSPSSSPPPSSSPSFSQPLSSSSSSSLLPALSPSYTTSDSSFPSALSSSSSSLSSPSYSSFLSLGLSSPVALAASRYLGAASPPSPVQAVGIPRLLQLFRRRESTRERRAIPERGREGKAEEEGQKKQDQRSAIPPETSAARRPLPSPPCLVLASQTGSGKTLAYALPLVDQLTREEEEEERQGQTGSSTHLGCGMSDDCPSLSSWTEDFMRANSPFPSSSSSRGSGGREGDAFADVLKSFEYRKAAFPRAIVLAPTWEISDQIYKTFRCLLFCSASGRPPPSPASDGTPVNRETRQTDSTLKNQSEPPPPSPPRPCSSSSSSSCSSSPSSPAGQSPSLRLSILNLAGGQSLGLQRQRLKSKASRLDLLVGTPPRILKFIEWGLLRLDALRYLIIDEIDVMLRRKDGFFSEIQKILREGGEDDGDQGEREKKEGEGKERDDAETGGVELEEVRKKKRRAEEADVKKEKKKPRMHAKTVGVAATVSPSLKRTLRELVSVHASSRIPVAEPIIIEIPGVHTPPQSLRHEMIDVGSRDKLQVLKEVLQTNSHVKQSKKVLIFTNSVKSCRACEHLLRDSLEGFDRGACSSRKGGGSAGTQKVTSCHGAMPHETRRLNFKKFVESPAYKFLVCTDIASRGLDIPSVESVLLFDFPLSPVEYLHRAGRTGRLGSAGRKGVVISLVTKRDAVLATAIQRSIETGLDSLTELSSDRKDYKEGGKFFFLSQAGGYRRTRPERKDLTEPYRQPSAKTRRGGWKHPKSIAWHQERAESLRRQRERRKREEEDKHRGKEKKRKEEQRHRSKQGAIIAALRRPQGRRRRL